jgi:hypothetical protein
MSFLRQFSMDRLHMKPLERRKNFISIIEGSVDPYDSGLEIPRSLQRRVDLIAKEMLEARKKGASVMCAFGAHTIKNGLGRVLSALIQHGWVTHLATNGAGVIHDWEFAFQGESSEDVRENVRHGEFGTWDETGLYINLALAVGAYEGLGYGESVGALISRNGIDIPSRQTLAASHKDEPLWRKAAAADLLELIEYLDIPEGFMNVEHAYPEYSVNAAAFEAGIPCTSHPMFGHDIIYTHPANRGAAIGRTASRDFLAYVEGVSRLEGGVYLSVGSAVMSPMIFEKSLSMARNAVQAEGGDITDCAIHVVDLQEETWDWSKGEPDKDNPAYYLRFMKTFSRMGCRADYISADNKLFLTALFRRLQKEDTSARGEHA